MSQVTYLHIDSPSVGQYLINEVSSPTDANAVSTSLPGNNRFTNFASNTASFLGDLHTDFSWPAGPIEVKGIVSTQSFGIGLELLFNDGDAGIRTIGTFWGSLKDGMHIEYSGSTNARIDIILREGKYVWVDAERGHWAKKRVILVLAEMRCKY